MTGSTIESAALREAVVASDKRRITLRDAIGFGIGDCFGGGQLALGTTYLALFWNRFGGMSITTAQGIIGACAIVSAFAALVFGVLDDNLYRFPIGLRFGRRRFLLALLSPLVLIGVFLWIPGLPVGVYAVVYVLWAMLPQAFQACYNPLPGEMAQDFDERTKLSTTRLFISTGTGTLIPLAGSATLAIFGEWRPVGYMIFAIGFTVWFSLSLFLCWRATWEMTPEEAGFGAWARGEVPRRRVGLLGWLRRLGKVLGEYASTLRIAEFRRHLSIYLLVQLAMDVFGQTFVFFVIYDWNRTAAFASLLLGCGVISLPLMPLFGWLLSAIGPRRLYAVNFIGCLAGVGWMFAAWRLVDVLPSTAWTVFAVAGVVVFFAFKSLCGYLPWSVFPFIADIDQLVTGRYRSATFSGIQSCLRQLGSGVVVIAVGAILGWVGFDSTLDTQSEMARDGLGAVLLGWFAIAMVLAWVISSQLTIDRETNLLVLREIDRLRAGGSKAQVDDETRKTVERLTGIPYEECWRG
ncbi:sodium:galactoside symporter [Bifidobacterium lemurum]|uniref:Sodium:galactoside symporter n=1 Tax=Bifidobacterium lemurum TaxID=1603886 RepID=A0A261FP65_9BIFI|nr:MFS transporter [Bifidobacterium lemurum]OZG60972.1 sodium:galactoside symporter [Bifidobacterium lemurum]